MKAREEAEELLEAPARREPEPPAGAALGALASGMGNAAFSAVLARAPKGGGKKGKKKEEEEETEEEPAGLDISGVLTKVTGAISAVQTIQAAWDQVFKSEVKTRFVPLPPMMTDETQARLNRVLRFETSRLLCEFVFEKSKLYGVDIKAHVDAQRAGKPLPAPAGADGPDVKALEKDLEGLNELAIGDLKDRATIIIAQARREADVEPDSIWWNDMDQWGFGKAPEYFELDAQWGGKKMRKGLEWGEIWARPRIGRLEKPMQAGLHPDVRYFRIPDTGTESVDPRWWLGGHIETKTHGRNVDDVTIDQLDTAPDKNKPMGVYQAVSTFDWDESNTIMRFQLRSYADDSKAGIIGIEREGKPDVGWV